VRKATKEMRWLGISRHEIIHAIREAVAGQIYIILKGKAPFDAKQYIQALKEILKMYQ